MSLYTRRFFDFIAAIVQELVLLHNGRIQARSEVGKGSAFIVRLPVSDSPEAPTIVRRFS